MGFFHRMRAKAASWQLPVRIPVPNRDNLIAMGLMALAFGLMVGVAIGPALGSASNAAQAVVSPFASATPEAPAEEEPEESTTSVALAAPAGGEPIMTASNNEPDTSSIPDTTADVPVDDSSDIPVEEAPEDQLESDDPDEEETQPVVDVDLIELKGTVLASASGGRNYVIADSSGNLLAVHASKVPAIGAGVAVQTLGLANGTFGEEEVPVDKGLREKSPLRGTVSWLDPVSRTAVLSSRGASLAVDLSAIPEEVYSTVMIGSSVEASTIVAEPVPSEDGLTSVTGLDALTAEVFGEPLTRIELNGVVQTVDPDLMTLTIAADSSGLIPATIEVALPKAFDPNLVLPDKAYSLTVKPSRAGGFVLTGLSANYSRKSADSPELAFGDQG